MCLKFDLPRNKDTQKWRPSTTVVSTCQAPNAGEMMANDVFETVQRKNLAWKEEEGILVNAWDRIFWRERGWVGATWII